MERDANVKTCNPVNLKTAPPSLRPYVPDLIEVTTRDGVPAAVRVRMRRLRVASVLNVWRIDEEWWRRPISRLYFLLELENSARITLFQDLIGGQWYRQHWA